MRGQSGPCGRARAERRCPGGPSQGRAAVTHPPHRTHPSRRFSGGSAGENGENGAPELGRPWGPAGDDSRGPRAAAGDGASAPGGSLALPPPGAISIRNLGPGPGRAASAVAGEGGLGDPGGEGNRPLVPTGWPWPRGPPRVGTHGWRERPPKRVGAAEEGAGRRAAREGGGRMSLSFVFTGVWWWGREAGKTPFCGA